MIGYHIYNNTNNNNNNDDIKKYNNMNYKMKLCDLLTNIMDSLRYKSFSYYT